MRQALVFALVAIISGFLSACGGSGGGGDPGGGGVGGPGGGGTPTSYGARSYAIGDNCAFALGTIVTNASSASSAESAARQACMSQAQSLAAGAGVQAPTCSTYSFTGCATIGIGENSAGRCNISGRERSSLSAARSAEIQNCQSQLGFDADCEILAAACATGGPDSGVWRPSARPTPPPPPPQGGVGSGQVGQEFGRTSTSGRSFNLTCTDDVVFSDSGNVVLPSVEVVTLPTAAGTVTLDYDAYDVPDRFVVELGGRVVIDTQYVGTSHSVAEVNAVLTRYGFTPTSQAGIISPGNGSRSFQKPAGVTSAVVRIYAPLTGTAWEVTMKFSGSSCGPGQGPGSPSTPLRNFDVSLSSSCARQVQICVSDHQCEDGDRISVDVNGSTVFSGELFNREQCVTAPVRAGVNSIRLFALNGTGYKGACSHADVNTGRIRVVGSTSATQSWSHSGGTGSSANLNVTVGQAGGSCPGGPTTQPPSSRLYGAIYTDLANDCSSHYYGIAANHNTEAAADTAARNQCRAAGGTNCQFTANFGSAYRGSHKCGALTFGETTTRCRLRVGTADSLSEAERNALSECRSGGFSCRLVTADDGGRFGLCTD